MANEIYLLTTSSYNEDFILDAYATSIDEAVEIAKGYFTWMFGLDRIESEVRKEGTTTIIKVWDNNDIDSQEFRVVSIPRFSPDIFSAN